LNREEKTQSVAALKEKIQKASITLLADFKGMKVNELNDLRRELRKSEARLQVVKNTLAKIAVKDTEFKALGEYFRETVALVTGEGDPVAPAKVLVKFAKDKETPKIKAGYLSGEIMKSSQVEALSKLPSREEMIAKLLGSMQAPAQNWVNVLAAVPRQWVTVLAAIRDKKSS
jgi:large subunit ribosomal protein L10